MEHAQESLVVYRFREAEAAQARGSVPLIFLPVVLVLRPGQFFRSWGIHASLVWVLLAAWVLGAAASINSVVNRLRFNSDFFGMQIDSWATIWLVVLGLGIARGVLFSYGLGGLWAWLRLRICGVHGNEWRRSTRIYCFSHLPEQIASLLALVYFSVRYETVTDFLAQPVGLVNLLAGLVLLWSPVIGFLGVRACYTLRPAWSAVLFLVLPMLWRLGLLGFLLVTLLGYDSSSSPKMIEYQGDTFRFVYPSDWSVLPDEELDEHSIAQIEIQSDHLQASTLIRVLDKGGIDPNEHDLAIIESKGFLVREKTVYADARIDSLYGYGEEYVLQKDGQVFTMFHLVSGFDKEYGILVRHLTSREDEGASRKSLGKIVDSLEITSADEILAMTQYPKVVSRDWFSHSAPSNWEELLDTHEQFDVVEQRAFGITSIRFTIYDRPGVGGPRKELDALLNYGMHKDNMRASEPMNSWLGFHGVGAKGTIWQPLLGMHDFWAIFVPLKDGRVFGIKKYQAQSSVGLTAPGFDLIESSFELLVEPAPVESVDDP